MLLFKTGLLPRAAAQLEPLPLQSQEVEYPCVVLLQAVSEEHLVLLQVDPYLLIHWPQFDLHDILPLERVRFY